MNSSGTCPECGKSVLPNGLQGLCPECMMKVGLAAETGEVGPDGAQIPRQESKAAPSLAEVARHFPQLEILECLGCGGMGAVYKARQRALDRIVALKILTRENTEQTRDAHFAQRFQREAQALAKLNHPNIIAVHEFGEAGGLPYLVMEYVDGLNLRQLERAGKLAPSEALNIVPQICEALQFAHNAGVVHRDIKPENILLDRNGRVKIADFGIAKILGRQRRAGTLTQAQQVVGTPHYMAPEQVERPAAVDHRADIYSLGVVFYEMLTGELPLGKFAPPSRKVRLDVRLDEVVLHALEKEPDRRYQHASQVKTDVETIATTPLSSGTERRDGSNSTDSELREGKAAARPPAWVTVSRWSARTLGTLLLAAFVLMLMAWGMQPLPSLGPREQLASAAWALALLGFVLGWRFEGAAALLIGLAWALFPLAKGLQPHPFLSPLAFYGVVAMLYAVCWWATRGRKTWILAAATVLILMVLGLSFLLVPVFAPSTSAAAPSPQLADNMPRSRAARWKADLEYFSRELPARHKDFFELIPKESFEKAMNQLQRDLPQVSDVEVVLRLKRLVAGLGVAHTRVGGPLEPLAFRRYPIAFFWYSDGLGVFAAAPEYREAIGCHVMQIGSLTPQQVEVAVAPYISRENEAWLHNESPGLMGVAEVLQWLKIAELDGRLRLSLTRPDGRPLTLDISPVDSGTPIRFMFAWEALPLAVPLCHKRPETPYWYEFLPQAQTLYLNYQACSSAPNAPFAEFVHQVLNVADSNSVARVIVDLRNNTGGDSSVVKPLIAGLKSRFRFGAKGQIYALIGRGTFSSGLLAALELRNEPGAILVGEPTGGKPNCYGNSPSFTLPNSRIQVWYCEKYFRTIPTSDPPSLEPDIPVSLSLTQFLAGRDPALEAALSEDARQSSSAHSVQTNAQDVAHVLAKDMLAGADPQKRFFLMGPKTGDATPTNGYALLLVLAGGDGGPDFVTFIKRIYLWAVPNDYLVAELIAPKWDQAQAEQIVWPTETRPYSGMKFSTESLIHAVIGELEKQYRLDTRRIFTLSWSSGGPAGYAASLCKSTRISGSIVAMSVFQPERLPALAAAHGQAYFLLHSPADTLVPIAAAHRARDSLTKNGAEVKLLNYEGGHGWHGDVFGNISTGIRWLEEQTARMLVNSQPKTDAESN